MSRFFHGGSSDSETETSSEEESVFSEEEQEVQVQGAVGGRFTKAAAATATRSAFSRFLRDEADSDESDDGKRVVRSAKEKLFEDLKATIRAAENAKKINDWTVIQIEFDKLIKQVAKAHAVLRDQGTPKFYIQFIIELDQFLCATLENKETKKKMNAVNAKALTAMKQKVRKLTKQMEADIEAYRKNPTEDADFNKKIESSEDEGERAEEAAVKPASKHRFFKKATTSSEEETESDEDNSELSSSDESVVGPNRWKKAEPSAADASKKKEKKKVVSKAKEEGNEAVQEKAPEAAKVLEITTATIYARLKEVLEARGRKGTDRDEQISILERVLAVCVTPVQKVHILMALVAARFDYNQGMSSYQSIELWKQTEHEIVHLFEVLEANPDVKVFAGASEPDELIDGDEAAESKEIRGSLVLFVSRLDDEFSKSLQNTDPHTMEYIERLKDEVRLYALIKRVESYYLRLQETQSVVILKVLLLDRIYHKQNDLIVMLEETASQNKSACVKSADVIVRDQCVYLYKHAPDRFRTRAVLCHVYHHALNMRYYDARDLLLMSHLQDSIQHTDIETQVLFNRTTAQLGICAFRCGLIKECHQSLNDLMAQIKTKDLFAQGTQLQKHQLNSELERKERMRVLPYHMHINLELLEAIQLTVSMLLEIPLLATDSIEAKKKVFSKHFRRLYEHSERQIFTGPPENYRDHIMQGSRALMEGNWQKCRNLILSIKTWDLLPNNAEVKSILADKIKQEGLRTFFFAFGSYNDNLSLADLAEQFELPPSKVYAIVSKMIMDEEVQASIDQPTSTVTISHVAPSRLQQLSVVYCEKLSSLVESNEKSFEQKFQSLHQAASAPMDGNRKAVNQQSQSRTGNTNSFKQRRPQPVAAS